MSQEALVTKLLERIAALEQENADLRAELAIESGSQFTFSGRICPRSRNGCLMRFNPLLDLESAYAMVLTEVIELRRQDSAMQAQINAAYEREQMAQQRATQLAKANDVLKYSLIRLTTEGNLESFLGHVLTEIAHQVEACSGHIFIFNAETNMLELRISVRDGQVHYGARPDEPELFQAPFPADINPAFQHLCEQRTILSLNKGEFDGLAWPGTMDWFQRDQIAEAACLALMVGDRAVGLLGLRFNTKLQLEPEEMELVYALAHQATLAIQLTLLTEDAQRTVRVCEQERAAQERVTELTKVNELLQSSLRKLAEEPEPEKFLGHILTVCTDRFGAAEAGIWRYEAGFFQLFVSYEDGAIKLGSTIAHPGSKLAIARNIRNHDVLAQLNKRELVIDYEEDFATRPVYEQFRDYFKQRGIQSAIKIPMFLDDVLRGILVLRFGDRRQFQPEEAELAYALANQAVLALELTRLADNAQQAALAKFSEQIAQEQKQAAQARAAELSRANEILSDGIGYLSTNPNFNDVLGHLLVEAVRYAGATIGHIFLYDSADDTLTMTVRYRDGQTHWTPADDEPSFLREAMPAATLFDYLRHQPKLSILNQGEFEGTMCASTVNWFCRAGYRTVVRCVLTIGKQPVGLLLMAFAQRTTLSPVDQELILALARQIALVIQLTHLAEIAQSTAIVEERNRMARDIHDNLAQTFTSILMRLQSASLSLADNIEDAQTDIARACALSREGLTNARRSVHALRPQSLDNQNLSDALANCLQRMIEGTAIHGNLQQVGHPPSLSADIELELFHIGQEAITNARKHAQAQAIHVTLAFLPDQIQLTVEDDGIGFILTQASALRGFGLISMQERAQRIGAQLRITSELGQGTQVSVTVDYRDE